MAQENFHVTDEAAAQADQNQDVYPREKAQKEIEGWLNVKKVSETKRKAYEDNIETLVGAMVAGSLSLDAEHRFRHKLLFAVEDKAGRKFLEELTYKPRVTVEAINNRMKGINISEQPSEAQLAYASALTGQPVAMLGKIDTEDMAILRAIVVFFI